MRAEVHGKKHIARLERRAAALDARFLASPDQADFDDERAELKSLRWAIDQLRDAAAAPVDGLVDFNINEEMKVKLTKRGMDLHRKNHDDLNRIITGRGGDAGEYRPPKLDADGFYETQMWCLMREFGKHICMGMDGPFETTIKLKVAALQSRDEGANAQGEAVAFREEVCAVLGEHIDTEDSRIIDAIEYLRSQCREPAAAMPDSLPDEPTEEMIEAMCKAATDCKWPQDFGKTAIEARQKHARAAYKAMLRAHMGRK